MIEDKFNATSAPRQSDFNSTFPREKVIYQERMPSANFFEGPYVSEIYYRAPYRSQTLYELNPRVATKDFNHEIIRPI